MIRYLYSLQAPAMTFFTYLNKFRKANHCNNIMKNFVRDSSDHLPSDLPINLSISSFLGTS